MGLWPQLLGSRVSSAGCTGLRAAWRLQLSRLFPLQTWISGLGRTGSAAPSSLPEFPLLLGAAAWSWRERLALALWCYFNSWAGWECGAFPLANDILRISLLSNYSWFRHLEAREQVWKATSRQVSVIKGTVSFFQDWRGDPEKTDFGLKENLGTGELEFSPQKDWFAINMWGGRRTVTLEK